MTNEINCSGLSSKVSVKAFKGDKQVFIWDYDLFDDDPDLELGYAINKSRWLGADKIIIEGVN